MLTQSRRIVQIVGANRERFVVVLLTVLFVVLHLAHLTGLRNILCLGISLWALPRLVGGRPPLLVPQSAWFVVAAASIAWSFVGWQTAKAVLYEVLFPAGVFYGAYIAGKDPSRRSVLINAVFLSNAVLAVATVLASTWAPEAPHGGPFLFPGGGEATTLAVLGLPLMLLVIHGASERPKELALLGLASVTIVGWVSGNRMFWPSVAAVAFAFYGWQWSAYGRRGRLRVLAGLLACLALVVTVFAYLYPGRNLYALVAQDNRPAAWQEWGRIAAQAPLLGHGFGLRNLEQVGRDKLPDAFVSENPEMLFHAHNLLLDLFVQLGIVGLAAFSVLLIRLGSYAWQARLLPDRGRMAGALAALIAGAIVKNLTDDFMHHAVVIAFWGYAGLLMASLTDSKRTPATRLAGS